MPVFVSLHLGQAQHGVLALAAVVVGLFSVVNAGGHAAVLGRRVLLEPSSHDRVHLLMLLPVGHHLVGVGAVVVALQAVEVRARFLRVTRRR